MRIITILLLLISLNIFGQNITINTVSGSNITINSSSRSTITINKGGSTPIDPEPPPQSWPPEAPSIASPTVYDYYIDSNAPDGGDGSLLSPFNQISDLAIQSGKSYAFKRGSCFREEFYARGLNNIIIGAYGTGNSPIFDAADKAANASFSKTAGRTNVYQISWTNNFRPGNPNQYSVWENGERLLRVNNVAQSDTIPGSYYAPTPTVGGPDIIYVHPKGSTNAITDGKTYEIPKREWSIVVGDSCKVYNVHTKRNGMNNGSFESGIVSYLYNVLAEDGVKHNLFMESGLAEYCTAWKADKPTVFGGATMYISYSNRTGGTLDVTWKNCNLFAYFNNDTTLLGGMIGFYTHKGGTVQYNKVYVDGGYWTGPEVIFSGELANGFEIKKTYATNFGRFFDGSTIAGPIDIDSNFIKSNSQYLIAAKEGTFNFRHNKINSIGATGGTSYFVRQSSGGSPTFNFTYNTFIADQSSASLFWCMATTMPTVTLIRNICLGTASTVPTFSTSVSSGAAAIANVTGSFNFYESPANHFLAFTNYAASTYETNVNTTMLRANFTGTLLNDNFFLSNSHPAFGVAGSYSTFDNIQRFPTTVAQQMEAWKLIPNCN